MKKDTSVLAQSCMINSIIGVPNIFFEKKSLIFKYMNVFCGRVFLELDEGLK